MEIEKNKAIARRFINLWGKGDRLSLIDELASPEITVYYPAFPHVIKGIAAAKGFYTERLPSIFGDPNVQIEEEIAEGDKVLSRFEWKGTHRGTFLGVPATDRPVTVWGMVIDRFEAGKIKDTRIIMDTLGLMMQLGAIPAPKA